MRPLKTKYFRTDQDLKKALKEEGLLSTREEITECPHGLIFGRKVWDHKKKVFKWYKVCVLCALRKILT